MADAGANPSNGNLLMHMVTRLYDSYSTAEKVIGSLAGAGIPPADISLVASDRGAASVPGDMATPPDPGAYPGMAETGITETGATSAGPSGIGATTPPAAGEGAAGAGAVAGTVVGGGLGLLAGLGSLAIPDVGPVVAAGWLVAALTGAGLGAGAGGLVGSLTGADVHPEESDLYAEEVRRGGALVSVRVHDDRAVETAAIMDRHDPVNWQERRASYATERRGSDTDPATTEGQSAKGIGGPKDPSPS